MRSVTYSADVAWRWAYHNTAWIRPGFRPGMAHIDPLDEHERGIMGSTGFWENIVCNKEMGEVEPNTQFL